MEVVEDGDELGAGDGFALVFALGAASTDNVGERVGDVVPVTVLTQRPADGGVVLGNGYLF